MINSLTLYQCHLANSLRRLIVQILLGTTVALINGKRRYRIEEISFISIWGVGLVRRTLWPLLSVFPSGEVNQKGWKTLHDTYFNSVSVKMSAIQGVCVEQGKTVEKSVFFSYSVCDVCYSHQKLRVLWMPSHTTLKYGGLCPRESVPLQTQSVIGEQNDKIYSANTTPIPDSNRK